MPSGATPSSMRSVPWLLQQRWDGSLSGRQYHQERYRQDLILEWNAAIYPRLQPTYRITAMDVPIEEDTRFLLMGSCKSTISIYPLQETFRCIQETTFSPDGRRIGSITTLQWYPVDTGIFLSAALSYATLWDTTKMAPVLSIEPYPLRRRLSCFHQGTHLAAVGSDLFGGTKLIDWKAGGSTTHELSFGSGTRRGAPQQGQVTAVRWSSLNSNILATCTDGSPYLWDIRYTSQPLVECRGDSLQSSSTNDPTISPACHSMESCVAKFQSDANHHHSRRDFSYSALAFDHSGQYLIAADNHDPVKVSVFDLLSLQGGMLPLQAKIRIQYGKSHDSAYFPLVLLTGEAGGPRGTLIWVPVGNTLQAYSLLGGDGVRPIQHRANEHDPDVWQVLRRVGHLGRIRCAVVASTRNSSEAIFTATDDGAVLVWEPEKQKAATRKRARNNDDTDTWE